jgi:hypothetical protein
MLWVATAVLGLALAGWLGAAWKIGADIETLTRTQLEEGNRQLARYRMLMRIDNYQRGLLGSSYRSCLAMPANDPASPPPDICFRNELSHGPVLMADGGIRTGLAALHSELDLSVYPPELTSVISGFFAGQPPLQLDGYVTLDGRTLGTLAISPVKVESPMGNARLDELRLEMDVSRDLVLQRSVLRGRGLMLDAMGGRFDLATLESTLTPSGMLAGTTPLYDTMTSMTGVAVTSPTLSFSSDLYIQGRSRDNNGLLFSDARIWLENLAVTGFPASKGYLGITVDGLDSAAMLRLYELIDEINQQMEQGMAMSLEGNSPEPAELTAASGKMEMLMAEAFELTTGKLLQKGKSRVAVEAVFEDTSPVLSAALEATYAGGLENVSDTAALMAMPPEQILGIHDISLNMDWLASLLPPPLQPQLLPLEEAGVIRRDGDRWRLSFLIRQGELSLNNQSMSLQDMQMLALSLQPQQADSQAGEGDLAEQYGWHTEYDRLATLVTAVYSSGSYISEHYSDYQSFPDAGDVGLTELFYGVLWHFDPASGELLVEMPEQGGFRRRAVRMNPQWFDDDETVYWNCLVVGGDIEEFEGCEFISPVRPETIPPLSP